MKTFRSLLLASAPAILAAALLLLPASASADAKGGAARQLSLSRAQVTTTTMASQSGRILTAMNCAKCKDSEAVVTEATFKAAQPVVKHVVTMHGCSDCATKPVSAGHGKMATMKVAHTCDMEPSGCCVSQ